MPGNSQPGFSDAALDPDLLATPYRIQTNWHVITGAPSCGKTTLINLLADRGFKTAPEGARLYLERELADGRSLEQIRSNHTVTEGGIAKMQLEIERGLRPEERIFLDRAIPDSLAWYRVFGLNPNDLLPECFHHRYASIFLLDPLPLQQNGLRYKDTALQGFTDAWHARDYSALGYSITRVPVLSPQERLAFILSELSSQGLI